MIFDFSFKTIDIILTCIAILFLLIQLFYYILFYLKPARYVKYCTKNKGRYCTELPSVSVVIYAKNEASHLESFLPLILNQEYPDFEVIVVNDGSTDDSKDVVTRLENQYKNLYQTYIPEGAKNLSRKKLALTVGIKAAKKDIILLSEANCYPQSNKWIYNMARNFTPGTEIVLGHTYNLKKKKFESLFMNWGKMFHTLRYISFAISEKPFMGIGSNMAYRKETFFEHRGFSKHLNLHFGDDDLFINAIANSRNTKVELTPDSYIIEDFENNHRAWKEQKLQYDFTSSFLKTPAKLTFQIEILSRYLFFGAIAALAFFGYPRIIPISVAAFLFIARYVIQIIVLHKTKKTLKYYLNPLTYLYFDLTEPLYGLYYKTVGLLSRKKNYTWKLK